MLRLLAPALGDVMARIADAESSAEAAMAVGQNARQMVLNRDPKLAAVESETTRLDQVATTLAQAIPASEAVHAALSARISTLEAKAVTVQRVTASTPALTLLASAADIAITWPTPFPDTNYSVAPQLEVTGITLAKTTVAVKAGSKTTTGCVISYASTGIAVSAGQALDVLAVRYG